MRTFVLSLAIVGASVASAQSFNLDFGNATAAPAIPGVAYGAAANQPGVWFGVNALAANVPVALNDISGGATLATLSATTAQFGFSFNNPLTVADDHALLDDQFDLGGVGAADSFTVSGLANGLYDVYIYAWASDSDTARTTVTLGGNAQGVGGAFAGLQQGVTHATYTNVLVNQNTISFTTNVTAGFGSLNGMQIVAVPEPGTFAAVGLGLLAIRRKRRQR